MPTIIELAQARDWPGLQARIEQLNTNGTIADEINELDADGRSALWHAVAADRQDIVYLLTNNGACVGTDEFHRTDFDGKHSGHFLFGLRFYNPAIRNSPLKLACERGNAQIVEHLLDRGIYEFNPNEPQFEKYRRAYVPVLIDTVARGNLDVAEALYQIYLGDLRDGELYSNSYIGSRTSALITAARNGHLELVQYIVSNELDAIDFQKNRFGDTALIAAYKNQQMEVFNYLLQQGANINITSNDSTLLGIAILRNDTQTVNLLLQHGADPDQHSGRDYLSPLELALHIENIDIVRTLIAAGANVADEFMYTLDFHRDEFFNQLIEAGADVNVEITLEDWRDGKHYRNVLEFVIDLAKGPDKCQALINAGSDVNHHHLHLAIKKGSIEICRQLISTGMNIDEKDANGKTALMLAAELGNTEIIDMLLADGADIDARDDNGITAQTYAENSGNQDAAHKIQAAYDPGSLGLDIKCPFM